MSYKPNAPGIRRIACWASAALAMLLAGCASLPSLEGRGASSALTDTAETTLGRVATPAAAAHPSLTGIHPLPDPRDAFAVRVLLAAVPGAAAAVDRRGRTPAAAAAVPP